MILLFRFLFGNTLCSVLSLLFPVLFCRMEPLVSSALHLALIVTPTVWSFMKSWTLLTHWQILVGHFPLSRSVMSLPPWSMVYVLTRRVLFVPATPIFYVWLKYFSFTLPSQSFGFHPTIYYCFRLHFMIFTFIYCLS